MRFHDRLALVTGASSGLGADFARQLARRGCNLVLVARRQAALEKLAEEIRQETGRTVTVASCDLSSPQQRQELAQKFPEVDILVNNAGLGVYGAFTEAPWEQLSQMLEVDIQALTHLTHLWAPRMKARGWGRVLQVASTASFQPCPSYAAYAASKAYVLNFSLALNHELKGSGVACTTLCPGVTATEFFQVSGQKVNFFQRKSMMTSDQVVRIGLEALQSGKPYAIAGRLNTLMALSARFLPTTWVTAIAARLMR